MAGDKINYPDTNCTYSGNDLALADKTTTKITLNFLLRGQPLSFPARELPFAVISWKPYVRHPIFDPEYRRYHGVIFFNLLNFK
jgi:hypothetical protein